MTTRLFFFLLLCTSRMTMSETPLDITFIYQQILENHPGIYNDSEDPMFCTKVATAYATHKAALDTASPDDYTTIASSFISTINDPYLRLVWNNLKKEEATVNEEKKLSLTMLTDAIAWINLPTFLNFSDEQLSDWQSIHDTLPALAQDHTLIFDLRNNRGGKGYYGHELAKALFTPDYFSYYRKLATKDTVTCWRASKRNIKLLTNGLLPLQEEEYEKIKKNMKKAYKDDLVYFSQANDLLPEGEAAPQHNVTSKIVVIINESTYAAALFFLDALKMMNYPVLVIGKTSDADGLYIDSRAITLPSGDGILYMPLKTLHHAFHPGNLPYIPDITFSNDINNTAALQEFVLNILTAETTE